MRIILLSFMLIFEFCTLKGPVKPDSKTAESLPPDSLAVNVYDLANRFDFTPITVDTIKGQFEYFDSNERSRLYRSRFIPMSGDFLLQYTEQSSKGIYVLEVNGKKIAIPPEVTMDPMSIRVYQFYHLGTRWLLLLGEGPYATGSFTAVVYYMMFNLEEETIKPYFFQSRYGSTKNIGYCNGNNTILSFWELRKTPETSRSHRIRRHDIVNDSIINVDLPIRLRYLENDEDQVMIAVKDTLICMSAAKKGVVKYSPKTGQCNKMKKWLHLVTT